MSARLLFRLKYGIFAGVVIALFAMLSCSDDEQIVSSSSKVDSPEVLQVSPSPGAEVSAINGVITITFSKPIEGNSVNGSSISIQPYVKMKYSMFTSSYVQMEPVEELREGTKYTVTIDRDIRDRDGHRLREPYEWSFSVRETVALYVTPDGTGDGTRRNPFGSIQQAVGRAEATGGVDAIYVATGEYHESIWISQGINIFGGRDVYDNWRLSQLDSTVVHGTSIQNQAVAMLVRGADAPVNIHDLKIISRDAGPEPSSSSFGVICEGATMVTMYGCSIRSGAGSPGADGSDGIPGADGNATNGARGGAGGAGGYEDGGYYEEDPVYGTWRWVFGTIVPPEPGEQGWCADGSQSGGAGGEIVSGNGEDGADGADGANGGGGPGEFLIVQPASFTMTRLQDGTDGEDGSGGCGGGGGAGDDVSYIGAFEPTVLGYPGGPGGAGGSGGGRGRGGQSGGCSIGLFAFVSYVRVDEGTISAGAGGDGGSGGTGAVGGTGEIGKQSDGAGGTGGNGGNGGNGGHGGGGAGGASIAVVECLSDTFLPYVKFQMLAAGKGGTSAGNPGRDGLRTALLEIRYSGE